MNLLNVNIENFPSEIKDPFQKDCIESVWFSIYKNSWSGEINMHSTVEFKN